LGLVFSDGPVIAGGGGWALEDVGPDVATVALNEGVLGVVLEALLSIRVVVHVLREA
jgi:hypothetical protein